MKLANSIFAMMAGVLLLTAGCASSEKPADITLDDLELKMARAMDPQKEYRNARTYFQRQNLIEEKLFNTDHQLVEVRFQRPDKFKFSYYRKNKIATEVLSVGGKAWLIDYQKGKIAAIEGQALEKIKLMIELGHPDTDYDKLFARVDMSLIQLEDERWYYKLVCHPKLPDANAIVIYVDQITSLPRRMELAVKTANGTINTHSNIAEYRNFGSVTLPVLTYVKDDTREYSTRVVDYQLNAVFDSKDFSLPVFDPVVMESQKLRRQR